MNNFRLGNPWLLFLLIPLIGGVILGFFLMKKEKRYTKKNIITFCLHLLLAVTISFAFADPQFLEIKENTEVYVLADASASEETSTDRIDEAIRKIREQAQEVPGTKVGVIAFAKDCRVLAKPGESFSTLKDVYEDETFDYSATDVEKALTFAAEQYSDNVIKRLVLISDGEETDGNAIDAMEAVIQAGIQLDALDLEADYPYEVAIASIEYTDNAYLNRAETLKVSVNATVQTSADINLYKDGTLLSTQNAYLANGVNVFTFDLDTSKAGEFTYKVEVTQQNDTTFNDTFRENNARSFVQKVTGDFNILFLGTNDTEVNEFKRLSGLDDQAKITTYLNAEKVPYALEDLIAYDEIVLSDIDMTKLEHYTEFIDNLYTAVSVYGKSVFTFNSTHVGNTNDEALTEYNDMLPVQYQPDDSRALVLLIDSSGSMGGNNIDMAIAGAKAVVDNLSINDSISIVTFDTDVRVPVTMTTIRNEQNRTDIKAKIDNIVVNGGTNMLDGLEEAFKQIDGVTAEYKNIITLSDGLPGDNPDDLKDYVTTISFSNISCSFINIGDLEGEEILKTLATLGNGKYYFIDSSFDLKDIMVDSIDQEVVNAVIEKESDIIYRMKDDPSLQGGVYNNLDTIGGYNYCRTKSGANTVLTVQYIHTNSENEISVIAVPLYAYWSFGRGKVSSFTSSLDTDWTSKLRNSAAGQTFFKNMISQSFPDRFNKSILDIDFTTNGSSSDIVVTPNIDNTDTRVTMAVTDRSLNTTSDYTLVYDGESFKGQIQTPNVGIYDATITYSKLNEETGEYETLETIDYTFSFDYSSEFDFFSDKDSILLYQLTDQSGGKLLAENDIRYEISSGQLSQASYTSAMVWFLAASVVIFLVDITIRKTTFRKRNANKEKTQNTQPNYF